MKHASRLGALVWMLCALLGACGGGDDDSGGAGSGPVVTPGLGQPCTGDCQSGLTCGSSGLFAHQCSALCSGIASCSMLAPTATTACFGSGTQECGIKCGTGVSGCPAGTHCTDVAGQMGCVVGSQ
jgi:hypothetical protein